MKLPVRQKPFSVSEFVVGSLALTAVAIVTFVGLRPQPPTPLPTAPASAPQHKIQSRLPRNSVNRPPREPSNRDAIIGALQPSGPRPGADESTSLSLARAPTTPATEPQKEETATPPPGTERDPQNRSDAMWMQARLSDLGYFTGNRNGVWGLASRTALRDFKSMNGLPESDRWDKETEQRLSSKEVIPASKTFIGGWAEEIDQCGSDRDRSAPIVISSRVAKTEGGECNFRSIKREGAGHWRVDAVCTSEGNSWNANIDLKLNGRNLIWSSERGTTTYVRCGKP
jgi:Putative peptidoglycan binding domain